MSALRTEDLRLKTIHSCVQLSAANTGRDDSSLRSSDVLSDDSPVLAGRSGGDMSTKLQHP